MPPKRKAVTLDEPVVASTVTTTTTTVSSSTTISTSTTTPPPPIQSDGNDNSDNNDSENESDQDTPIATTVTTKVSGPKSKKSLNLDVIVCKEGNYLPKEIGLLVSWKHNDNDFDPALLPTIESEYQSFLSNPSPSSKVIISPTISVDFGKNTMIDLANNSSDGSNTTEVLKRCKYIPLWVWEKRRSEFTSFPLDVSDKIDIAFVAGKSKVGIDPERYINLSTYEQARFDNANKTRKVKRIFFNTTEISNPAWYFKDSILGWQELPDSVNIEARYQSILKSSDELNIKLTNGDIFSFFTFTITKDKTNPPVEIVVKRDVGNIAPLKKTFSQLSEEEIKKLVNSVLSGDKSIDSIQPNIAAAITGATTTTSTTTSKSSDSSLYLPGEEDIIKSDKPMKYVFYPSRHFDSSAADFHFRTAESQFYRLLKSSSSSYKVTKVEYVVNPKLLKLFNKKKEEFEKLKYSDCNPVFGFHGTDSKNIAPICTNNFSVPGTNGVKNKTDSGWYGAGIYFSEYPEYSIGYISDCNKILLCKVLLGKSFKCNGLIVGQKCQSGYTSHLSPDEKELVIFHPDQILPCYVVHYDGGKVKANSTAHVAAQAQPSSNLLSGLKIATSGTGFNLSAANIKTLVAKHGGASAASINAAGITHLITNATEVANNSKITALESTNTHIVNEEWLYDSITAGKIKNTIEYSFYLRQTNTRGAIKPIGLNEDGALPDDDDEQVDTTPPKPQCKYGAQCYRKNADHFKQFSHPFLIG
ncbi:hypothetical protein CYY_003952 [Polysphondylium violaceum]|uniref:Poly [ADP-ribose] polymerase n=1 Tax=Polysphondylium violaceum TaxID=133409 RepID=A0A8J4PWW9_9MYCE|nr:hypothetical protein CYY_003952 [Polysphondylium violaceum]